MSEDESDLYLELCKAMADKVGLLDEETRTILKFEIVKIETMTPTSLRLVVEEERRIEFQEESQILEILGDNQMGKTFTLLYLSNLLGYNFFDEENKKFLADEIVIRQGQEVFGRLQNGIEAELLVIAEQKRISILVKAGCAEIVVFQDSKKILEYEFDLKTQSSAFRDCVKRFVDVQFVSKGRNFDGQLLIDICVQLRRCLETVQKNTDNLIVVYKDKLDELAAGKPISELYEEKNAISSEINELNAALAGLATSIAGFQSKLALLEDVSHALAEFEKTEVFRIYRDIVQLEEKLQSAEKKKLADQLESIESELSAKKEIYDAVESEFADAISHMKQRSTEFTDKLQLSSFLSILRDRDLDSLKEERERYDSSTYSVVEEIHKKTEGFDGTIRLPSELGGSVKSLQIRVQKAKDEVTDQSILKSLTDPLVNIVTKHQIQSSTSYQNLKDEVERLVQKSSQLKGEITEISVWSPKQIRQMQEKLASSKEKLADLDKADKDKIAGLEAKLQPYEDLSAVLYSPNWKEELLKLKFKGEEELKKATEEQNQTNQKVEESRKHLLEIEGILSRPEFATYSQGIDRLNKFSATLTTLKSVLQSKENLINRDSVQEEFDHLSEHSIPSLLDNTINKIFLSRCKYYFKMAEENKCQIFEIERFDYRNKLFYHDDVQKSVIDLSGGTASIMTVLSLATRATESSFGKILLIDEFHDVAAALRQEAYRLLQPIGGLSFAFFAKPVDGLELTVQRVEVPD